MCKVRRMLFYKRRSPIRASLIPINVFSRIKPQGAIDRRAADAEPASRCGSVQVRIAGAELAGANVGQDFFGHFDELSTSKNKSATAETLLKKIIILADAACQATCCDSRRGNENAQAHGRHGHPMFRHGAARPVSSLRARGRCAEDGVILAEDPVRLGVFLMWNRDNSRSARPTAR